MNILKLLLKEAAELDSEKLVKDSEKAAEIAENDILNGRKHNAHVDETDVLQNEKHLKEDMLPRIAFNYIRLYELDLFITEAQKIITELGNYGFIVLRNKLSLYGLMFKSVGVNDKGLIIFKFHIYSYPQDGLIRGGNTFFTTPEGISTAIRKALTNIN